MWPPNECAVMCSNTHPPTHKHTRKCFRQLVINTAKKALASSSRVKVGRVRKVSGGKEVGVL